MAGLPDCRARRGTSPTLPDQHRSLVGVLNRQPRLRQSPEISIVSVRGDVEVAHTSVEGRRVERGTGARQLCDTA